MKKVLIILAAFLFVPAINLFAQSGLVLPVFNSHTIPHQFEVKHQDSHTNLKVEREVKVAKVVAKEALNISDFSPSFIEWMQKEDMKRKMFYTSY